jgi:hypothetical protein
MIWPTPHAMTLSLSVGDPGSRLVLPVVPHEDRPAPSFRPPDAHARPPGVESEDRVVPIDWTLRREDGHAVAGWTGDWSSAFGFRLDAQKLRFDAPTTTRARLGVGRGDQRRRAARPDALAA